MELQRFVGSTLQRLGCVAEVVDGDALEVLLPSPIAASLGLPEEGRLRLSGAPQAGEVHAGYGSALLSQICSLTEGAGRRFRAELALSLPKRERVEREALSVVSFRNAVGRIESIEPDRLDYLAFDFCYAALSEERHEGLLSVAVNLDGGWSPGLGEALERSLSRHPETRQPWTAVPAEPDPRPHYAAARSLALARALSESRPFIARMERRMNRDLRRVGEYYDALRQEVERKRTRGRRGEPSREKVEAVEGERRRRQQDLRRRYAVTLRVEPLALLALRMTGLRLQARLQRRKNEKRVRLGWNPVARRWDAWLCAGCGGEAGLPALCDRLHLLCPGCPPECPDCGRDACPACRPGPCPCGRRRAAFPALHAGAMSGREDGDIPSP